MTWLDSLRDLDPEREVVPGVTAAELVELHTRPPDPAGTVFRASVEYGRGGQDGPPLLLDLYARADPTERRAGVIFVHGGGWFTGHRSGQLRNACELARLGFVTATISYRLHQEALWPAALEDVKCALRWMRANADSLGLDPDRLGAAGSSAGGNLVAMAALTPGWHEGSGGHGEQSSAVQAVALINPATDVRTLTALPAEAADRIAAYFDHPGADHRAEASPVEHVRPGAPPFLTLTGADDTLTTVDVIRVFHDRLDEAGVRNELHVFEGKGHAFANIPGAWHECFARMAAFFQKELGAG